MVFVGCLLHPFTPTRGWHKHFCSYLATPKKLLIEWFYVFFKKSVIQLQGNHCVILTLTKWNQELECNIFFLKHLKILYYNLVFYVAKRCYMKILALLMAQIFAINMFSFGDVNNTSRYWVKSLQKHIIVLKIRNVFILCVKNYPRGGKPKHCSSMMRWAKPFEIPSVVVFSLSYVKDINCQEIRSNAWTLCLVCDQCWLDCHGGRQSMSIMKSLLNILKHIWVFLHQIIPDSCNI